MNKRIVHFDLDMHTSNIVPLEDSDNKERMYNIINKAIDNSLTYKQAEIVKMYYFRRLTCNEIAMQLGVNKSTVSRHLSSSRHKLSAVLSIINSRY